MEICPDAELKNPVTVEMMLHCLLRWLAGGSYLDHSVMVLAKLHFTITSIGVLMQFWLLQTWHIGFQKLNKN